MPQTSFHRNIDISKTDEDRQIVYGEVYVPNERDAHGHWMAPAEVESMAHRFMKTLADMGSDRIDTNHSFLGNGAYPVESFVARKGDADFTEGAWVLGVYVPDTKLWKAIQKGDLTGFSLAGMGQLLPDEGGISA